MLIGYARVSTTDQNVQLQVDALKGANCEKIFEEKASGADADRQVLLQVLSMARSGDCVVVWKLDRLARSLAKLIAIINDLEVRNIGFRSITEAIDTTTPGGRLVFHVFGALAEFERAIIRERTKAGLEAARKLGRKGGRPKALTDSDISAAKALLSNPRITAHEVARRLSVSVSTLYRHTSIPARPRAQTCSPSESDPLI